MTYTTDEEKVEELKRWWKENGTSLIVGLTLAVGAVLGWQAWEKWQDNRMESASQFYNQMLQQMEQPAAALNIGEQIMTQFGASPYADLAALLMARLYFEQGELDAAQAQLEWAVGQAEQDEVRHLARLRLAQLLWARGETDAALARLDADYPDSFAPAIAELRGDILRERGELAQARSAYDAALAAALLAGQDTTLLQLKRDELGQPDNDA